MEQQITLNQRPAGIGATLMLAAPMLAMVVGILSFTPWPWLAAVLMVLAALTILMVRFPEPFFLCIVILIPMTAWRGLSEHLPALTVSKLLGIPLICAVALRIVFYPSESRQLFTRYWTAPALLLMAWVIAAMQSPWRAEALNNTRQLLQSLSFALLAAWCAGRAGGVRRMTLALASSGSAAAVLAVGGYLLHIPGLSMTPGGSEGPAIRAIGPGGDPNIFAATTLFCLPSIVAWMVRSRGLSRIVWASACLLACAAVIFTYSRSIMIMLFGALAMLGFEHRRRLPVRHLPFAIPLIVGMLIVGIITAGSTPWQRLASLASPAGDPSLLRRASYIGVAFSAVTQRPLIGWGPGAFDQLYAHSRWAAAFAVNSQDFFRRAHNTFLEIAVGSGLIGLGLFVACCGLALRGLLSPHTAEDMLLQRSVGLGFVMLLIAFLTLSDPYQKYIWLSMGIGLTAAPRAPTLPEAT
jgi:putative inorganic carbon (HCO3(-)) transporter